MFIGLLASVVNASNHTECVYVNNQQNITQPTLIKLNPNKFGQGLHNYPFAINLDRCVGSCNTLSDLCRRVCIPDKTEDVNLNVFNMITAINESRTLTNQISCKYKCNCDSMNII